MKIIPSGKSSISVGSERVSQYDQFGHIDSSKVDWDTIDAQEADKKDVEAIISIPCWMR